jgi:dUTP pyrophosphatase
MLAAVPALPIHRLDPDLPLPSYARAGDAGLDLFAREGCVLEPGGGRFVVPCAASWA